jgi:feruloyl esterase
LTVPTAIPNAAAICLLRRPTADSDIRFEVWLPTNGWNHRFQQGGNGGLAGAMFYWQMIDALLRGSATAGTDDGHQSTNVFDASWIPGHPEKVIDYGYRAVHLTALASQAIVQAYYGEKAKHSYFLGCSDGARESLMEAQRYPQDFEGYLVGSAGDPFFYNNVRLMAAHRALAALGPDQQLAPSQLASLSDRVLQRCDALDGVKDGVLRDPRDCHFNAHEMICQGAPDGSCLTPTQADAVQSIYEGFKDPATGQQLAPGTFGTLGTERVTWPNMIDVHLDEKGLVSEGAGAATLIYGDPNYGDPHVPLNLVQMAKDIPKAKIVPIIYSDNPDLRQAQTLGRKIIQWHGWADPVVMPQYAIAYAEAVRKLMGADPGDFYRLFMVPGMRHCQDGVGPTVLGGFSDGPTNRDGVADTSGAPGDAEHDIVSALERWVEQGVAPERIIVSEYDGYGSTFPGFRAVPPGTRVKSTRPVCPYPQVAVYKGAGSTDDAANFRCGASPGS